MSMVSAWGMTGRHAQDEADVVRETGSAAHTHLFVVICSLLVAIVQFISTDDAQFVSAV